MKTKKEEKTKPVFRNAVFIVVYKKEKGKIEYLLLKRKKHWIGWEFPKGGIEKGETPKSAVRRETQEESGSRPIKILRYPITGKYRYKNVFPDRPGAIGQIYTLWSAEIPSSSKIKIDKKEHSAYKWMGLKGALNILTFNNQKKCLKFVNKKLIK